MKNTLQWKKKCLEVSKEAPEQWVGKKRKEDCNWVKHMYNFLSKAQAFFFLKLHPTSPEWVSANLKKASFWSNCKNDHICSWQSGPSGIAFVNSICFRVADCTSCFKGHFLGAVIRPSGFSWYTSGPTGKSMSDSIPVHVVTLWCSASLQPELASRIDSCFPLTCGQAPFFFVLRYSLIQLIQHLSFHPEIWMIDTWWHCSEVAPKADPQKEMCTSPVWACQPHPTRLTFNIKAECANKSMRLRQGQLQGWV